MTNPVPNSNVFLDSIVDTVRQHNGLTGKRVITAIREFVDTSDPVHGPGDDGAIVPIGDHQVVACGEAISPRFVNSDPYGAAISAVLANVNDVAAMGGIPRAIVSTMIGPRKITDEVMRGLRDASEMYDVALVGGHLTEYDGEASLSAFAIGDVVKVLSMANVRPHQELLFVCSLAGKMRPDFPYFSSIANQRSTLARDIRLFAEVAASGLAVAAKDVSMAGPLGSLAMLLEFKRCGANIDIRKIPMPDDTDPLCWLVAFPTYGFWLTAEPESAADCAAVFESRGLICARVGKTINSSELTLVDGDSRRVLFDLATEAITGLWVND